MSSANIIGLIEQGKRSIRDGKKEEAQTFLLKAIEFDEYNEDAWLWLASAVETEEEMRTCLDNVLIINPANVQARKMQDELNRSRNLPTGATTNPFTLDGSALDRKRLDFGNSPLDTEEDTDAFESFIEKATSVPATADRNRGQTFDALADDPFAAFDTAGNWTSPEDTFGTNPFQSEPAPSRPKPLNARKPSTKPDATPPKRAGSLLEKSSPPPPSAPEKERGKPKESLADDFSLLSTTQPQGKTKDSGVFAQETGAQEAYEADNDEVDYLTYLPAHIKATRVPGTRERSPIGMLLGVGLMVMLNLVAVTALVWQVVQAFSN